MNQQGERKVRRVRFEALEDSDTWDTIRSCDPVRADGVTPLTGRQRFDDVEYRALALGVKHRFRSRVPGKTATAQTRHGKLRLGWPKLLCPALPASSAE